MQIFIVGSIFETAKALDKKRFNKQIIETKQIIAAITGEKQSWNHHPIVFMYKGNLDWLKLYLAVLENFRDGNFESARIISESAETSKPVFLYEVSYLENMKRRLYTKDPNHYSQWADLGESHVNMYYVNGEWKYYEQE